MGWVEWVDMSMDWQTRTQVGGWVNKIGQVDVDAKVGKLVRWGERCPSSKNVDGSVAEVSADHDWQEGRTGNMTGVVISKVQLLAHRKKVKKGHIATRSGDVTGINAATAMVMVGLKRSVIE